MQPWTEALPKRLFSCSVHAGLGPLNLGYRYTPYEGLNLDNQISRKLEGNHSIFHCYSDIY